eukprot:PRCOL_00004935-RA
MVSAPAAAPAPAAAGDAAYECVRGTTKLVGPGSHPECRAVFQEQQRAATGKKRVDVEGIRASASTLVQVDGSWVRYNKDGKKLIKVPGNYADLKLFAVDPEMSADWQIILLALGSILSAFGYEEYGIPRAVSGGVFTFIKVFALAWASLYWCEACQDIILSA